MSKLAEKREYTCARCNRIIGLFVTHVAVAFKFAGRGAWEEYRHYCPACSADPGMAVLFLDVLQQPLELVKIRRWWS